MKHLLLKIGTRNFCIISLLSFLFLSQRNNIEAAVPVFEKDSLSISLLFNSPIENTSYTIYGHLGLRVQDAKNQSDYTYNYGVANFDAPNFITNFISGKADDYFVERTPTYTYLEGYFYSGCSIQELLLNLSKEEKEKILATLKQNIKKENARYRYNFLNNNCATRPLSILEKCIDGELVFPKNHDKKSIRKLIDDCNTKRPWLKLGTDLALGSAADKKVGIKGQTFLPVFLVDILKYCKIIDPKGKERRLVKKINFYPKRYFYKEIESTPYYLSPTPLLFSLLIILTLFFFLVLRISKKQASKYIKGSFILLLFLEIIVGAILCYLSFFSLHPLTYPNWNILLFNPLCAFIGIWILLFAKRDKIKKVFSLIFIGINVFYIILFYFFAYKKAISLYFSFRY